MRKTALVLNSVVVVFFACFLAYTFLARQHLNGLARDFVTEKTLVYSQPVVEFADQALDSPLIKKLLADDQAIAIRGEITAYRKDPSSYVSDLTRSQNRVMPWADPNPRLEEIVSVKEKIRAFYDRTLDALITDLQIFSLSNLIAGLAALGMAYRSASEIRKPIVWFSVLMFVAVLYCSYLYIDDLTFFRILFRSHMGWWYAATLCVVILALYRDSGRRDAATERLEVPEAAGGAASGAQSVAAAE